VKKSQEQKLSGKVDGKDRVYFFAAIGHNILETFLGC
jgi:hypothetical protein